MLIIYKALILITRPIDLRNSVSYFNWQMDEIDKVLVEAKALARKYKTLTGKPLGITGEVAEFSAMRLLGLELAMARQSGYDAIRNENGTVTKIQIKGRCISANAKPGQRLGRIQLNTEWDSVLLVLMDEDFEVLSIYEADRPAIAQALLAPGSKARNERGALAVYTFKKIGREIWKRNQSHNGLLPHEMTTSVTEIQVAKGEDVRVTEDTLTLDLDDGRTISIPLAWYPRLFNGTVEERNRWEWIGDNEGIHWPDLDEDINVEGIIAGRRSGESQRSLQRWLEQR